uniref:Uncharacterized protein n=1 Tax=Octopus bimaculoides TaxID=37653 RepID=A0A0L8G4D9_OCTBM
MITITTTTTTIITTTTTIITTTTTIITTPSHFSQSITFITISSHRKVYLCLNLLLKPFNGVLMCFLVLFHTKLSILKHVQSV